MIKNRLLYNEYSDWRFDVKKAEGSFIWDTNGKKLIDFTSGWNVTNLGWNDPEITEAIIKQAKINTYVPGWTADPIQNELAYQLTKSLPDKLVAVARATGGTEANEEALKTARAYTSRKLIIGFKDTYHGHSFATSAIGYPSSYNVWKNFGPIPGSFMQIDFPNSYRTNKSSEKLLSDFSKKLETLLRNKTVAAIVTEAGIITGWGSTYVAPKGYLKIVRDLTKKYGTLMILDEVGTGYSRLGKLFGMEIEEVVPDIVTFAKGFCNGAAAIAAMVTSKEIAENTWKKTNIYSTFGWTPIACSAALKTLQIHKRDKVWEKSKKDGEYMTKILRNELKNNQWVGDIRGIGMEIGIDFVKNKKTKEKNAQMVNKVFIKASNSGLHVVCDHESVIQIMPPLTIEKNVLNQGIDILVKSIKSASKQ